jgi:integrase
MARRENGAGTIRYDHERKRWEARITVEMSGRNARRKKMTAKTKPELLERLKEATRALDDGLPVANRQQTVAAFLRDWLEHVTYTDRSVSTVDSYNEITRNYVVPYVGRIKLGKLEPRHVEKMQRDILKNGKSPRTARSARAVLRTALRHAERHGLVQRNVAALAEPVAAVHGEKKSMTAKQVRTLINSVRGTRDGAAITVLCTTGLRRAELLGLKWSDVDLKKGMITVQRGLQRTSAGMAASDLKTARSRRTVQIPPVTLETLKVHRRRQNEDRMRAGEHWAGDDWVFTTTWGSPLDPDNLSHRFVDACEAAKIGRWTCHDARHTVGSLMFANGADLRVVSEHLGHASIRTTSDVYVHQMPEKSGEAVAAITRALG